MVEHFHFSLKFTFQLYNILYSRSGVFGNSIQWELYQPPFESHEINNVNSGESSQNGFPKEDYLDNSCRHFTSEVNSVFQNPSYPSEENRTVICQHAVEPKHGYCALRIEFVDTTFSRRREGCSLDSFQILNSLDTPASAQCGILSSYQCIFQTNRARLYVTNFDSPISQILCGWLLEE